MTLYNKKGAKGLFYIYRIDKQGKFTYYWVAKKDSSPDNDENFFIDIRCYGKEEFCKLFKEIK